MLRIIDKHNGFVIQKITKPNGALIAYQTGLETAIGTAGDFKRHTTLETARQAIGAPKPQNSVTTLPKALCPHNQKGYRADSQRKAKA